MRPCYVTKKHGGIYIDSPYDADFIELLKRHVPQEFRKWNPVMKQWWVHDKYARQAQIDARAVYGDVIEV